MKLRFVGAAIVLVCLLLYDFESEALLHRLVLPIALAVGAWMLVNNLTAVCLAVSFLALAHSELTSEDWVVSLAYPAVAALCGACLLTIVIARFHDRIRETHEARWQHRKQDPGTGE
ncbi:MAG: hypothetical protein O7G86_07540 [Gammaproteobacteria bacterium]|nr:hypothetical protein [Gammaproteobacteria bacterium]